LERLHLPRDYGFGKNVPGSTSQLVEEMQSVLQGKPSELMQTALWNGGFYLWRSGISPDIRSGIVKAGLLTGGQVAQKTQEIVSSIPQFFPRGKSQLSSDSDHGSKGDHWLSLIVS